MTGVMRLVLTTAMVIAFVMADDSAAIAGVLDDGYEPPVTAPVADPFRLPRNAYGAGNRGLEYATTPGQPVRAGGDGTVAFAGSVAGRLVVSIDHADGLRTTYSGLLRIDAVAGRRVARGALVGAASVRFHFGVRAGAGYLDPTLLFEASRGPVRLVPIAGLGPSAVGGGGGTAPRHR